MYAHILQQRRDPQRIGERYGRNRGFVRCYECGPGHWNRLVAADKTSDFMVML